MTQLRRMISQFIDENNVNNVAKINDLKEEDVYNFIVDLFDYVGYKQSNPHVITEIIDQTLPEEITKTIDRMKTREYKLQTTSSFGPELGPNEYFYIFVPIDQNV